MAIPTATTLKNFVTSHLLERFVAVDNLSVRGLQRWSKRNDAPQAAWRVLACVCVMLSGDARPVGLQIYDFGFTIYESLSIRTPGRKSSFVNRKFLVPLCLSSYRASFVNSYSSVRVRPGAPFRSAKVEGRSPTGFLSHFSGLWCNSSISPCEGDGPGANPGFLTKSAEVQTCTVF